MALRANALSPIFQLHLRVCDGDMGRHCDLDDRLPLAPGSARYPWRRTALSVRRAGSYFSRPRPFSQAAISTADVVIPPVANLTPMQPERARLVKSGVGPRRWQGDGRTKTIAVIEKDSRPRLAPPLASIVRCLGCCGHVSRQSVIRSMDLTNDGFLCSSTVKSLAKRAFDPIGTSIAWPTFRADGG